MGLMVATKQLYGARYGLEMRCKNSTRHAYGQVHRDRTRGSLAVWVARQEPVYLKLADNGQAVHCSLGLPQTMHMYRSSRAEGEK